MKAIGVSEFGDLSHLKMLDVPTPEPTKGRIIIKTDAFALNPYDIGIIDGSQSKFRPIKLPAIPGSDVAGVVVDKDAPVTEFKIGDRIVGRANIAGYAEYVSVPHLRAVKIPDQVSSEVAAALPNASISAYDIVFGALKDHHFSTALVIGATGAVGSTVSQILDNEGKNVSVVINSAKVDDLAPFSYEKVAFYDAPETIDSLPNFDVIINAAPQTELASIYAKHLNQDGVILSTTGVEQFDVPEKQKIDFSDVDFKLNHAALEYLVKNVGEQKLSITVAKILDFNVQDVKAALDTIRDHHPSGKYVVKL